MDVEALRNSPAGQLVRISGMDGRSGNPYDHWAFLPHPLPASVELASETRDAVTDAALALGRLDQAALQVPNPALLRNPTLRREAQSTSALEGTYAPLAEVFAADNDDRTRSPELSEIRAYILAAEYAYAWVSERRKITRGLINGVHEILLADVPGMSGRIGEVRDIQVVIGSGGPIERSRFVPPPPGPELDAAFSDLVDWIDRPQARASQSIVDSAMAHYQFETLHPYNDGNGRIGRLLIVLQLVASGVLSEPILSVSPWFESRRAQYQDELWEMSVTGDVDRWVTFFCEALRARASATVQKVTELVAFQKSAVAQVRASGRSSVATDIATGLVEHPVVTVAAAAKRYEVSFGAANTAMQRLVGLGLVSESERRGNERQFVCEQVLDLLSRS